MDSTELVKAIRYCVSSEDECSCGDCPYCETITCEVDLMEKAADAIEELANWWSMAKTLSDMVMPKWIPVTERLPEMFHQVLVYGLNGIQIDYYTGEKSIGGRPLFMISEAKVTHWQPLPEPPKEETE